MIFVGYMKITNIPKSSKNIVIKEMSPFENTLAVGNVDGVIYFNDEL